MRTAKLNLIMQHIKIVAKDVSVFFSRNFEALSKPLLI